MVSDWSLLFDDTKSKNTREPCVNFCFQPLNLQHLSFLRFGTNKWQTENPTDFRWIKTDERKAARQVDGITGTKRIKAHTTCSLTDTASALMNPGWMFSLTLPVWPSWAEVRDNRNWTEWHLNRLCSQKVSRKSFYFHLTGKWHWLGKGWGGMATMSRCERTWLT